MIIQIMELLINQFSLSSCYFLPLKDHNLCQHHVLWHNQSKLQCLKQNSLKHDLVIILPFHKMLTSAFCAFAALISSEQTPMLTFLSDFAVIWQTATIFLHFSDDIFLRLSFNGCLFPAQRPRNDVNVAEYKWQFLFEICNSIWNQG